MEIEPVDEVANKIAQLMNDGKNEEALKKWDDEIKELKYFECIVLRNKIHKLTGV
jgi:hypothetical protein